MKYKAIFIDKVHGQILLGEAETKKEAQKIINYHKETSRELLEINPFAKLSYSNEYRIDKEENNE